MQISFAYSSSYHMDSASALIIFKKKQPPLAPALGCLCWQRTWKLFQKTDIREEWNLSCSGLCLAIRNCQADSGLFISDSYF